MSRHLASEPGSKEKVRRIFRDAAKARRAESRNLVFLAALSLTLWTAFSLLPQNVFL